MHDYFSPIMVIWFSTFFKITPSVQQVNNKIRSVVQKKFNCVISVQVAARGQRAWLSRGAAPRVDAASTPLPRPSAENESTFFVPTLKTPVWRAQPGRTSGEKSGKPSAFSASLVQHSTNLNIKSPASSKKEKLQQTPVTSRGFKKKPTTVEEVTQ
jgi:hypothetical protein